jgi:hypothetical protein
VASEVNCEGLTWAEWFAATFWRSANDIQMVHLLYSWKDGVDPSEFRKILTNKYYNRFSHGIRIDNV